MFVNCVVEGRHFVMIYTVVEQPVEKEKPGGLVSKKRPSADLDAPPAKRPALPPPAQPKTGEFPLFWSSNDSCHLNSE